MSAKDTGSAMPIEMQLPGGQRESDFISVVSHELRTPLTAVSGFLSMLLRQDFGELNDQQIHYLNRAYQASRRTMELVEDLLNVSIIDAGKVNLQIKPVVIESIVSDVLGALAEKSAECNVSVQVKRRQNLPMVLADQVRLRQILHNLIDNAIKYSPAGAKVVVDFRIDGDELITIVADEGVGISKGQFDQLFTKFGRIHNPMTARAKGSGLGLYIVKHLVDQHGGRVWITSQEGKGSKFRFSMPIAKQLSLLD